MFRAIAKDQMGVSRAFGNGPTKKEATEQCAIIVQEYKTERPDLHLTIEAPFKLENENS